MEYIACKWPEVTVIASNQITREWREYERSNTTVLSAYVKPIVQKYVTSLTQQLSNMSFNGSLYLMQSNGGMDTSSHIIDSPLTLLESGPASGMYGTAELGKMLGDGGGLHASFLAYELMIKKIILPRHASVFSALGMLLSDVRREFIQTQFIDLSDANSQAEILKSLAKIKQHARSSLLKNGDLNNGILFTCYGRFRYQNQEHYVEIIIPDHLGMNDIITHLSDDFHNAYQAEYTYKLDSIIELVGFRVVVSVQMSKINIPKLSKNNFLLKEAFTGYREVDFLEFGVQNMTSIFDGNRLNPGDRIEGPAIIERSDDACVILPKTQAMIDDYGNIIIDMEKLLYLDIPKELHSDQMSLRIIQKICEATTKEMFTTFGRAAMSTIYDNFYINITFAPAAERIVSTANSLYGPGVAGAVKAVFVA